MPASGDPSWSDASTAFANAIAFSLPTRSAKLRMAARLRLADPELGQDPADLLRRAVRRSRSDEIADRRVEAHAGLDRDRELVDEVRQLGVDRDRPAGRPPS